MSDRSAYTLAWTNDTYHYREPFEKMVKAAGKSPCEFLRDMVIERLNSNQKQQAPHHGQEEVLAAIGELTQQIEMRLPASNETESPEVEDRKLTLLQRVADTTTAILEIVEQISDRIETGNLDEIRKQSRIARYESFGCRMDLQYFSITALRAMCSILRHSFSVMDSIDHRSQEELNKEFEKLAESIFPVFSKQEIQKDLPVEQRIARTIYKSHEPISMSSGDVDEYRHKQ